MRGRSRTVRSGAVGLLVGALVVGLGGCSRQNCHRDDTGDTPAPPAPSAWNLASSPTLAFVDGIEHVGSEEECGTQLLDVELRGVAAVGSAARPPDGTRFRFAPSVRPATLEGSLGSTGEGRLLVAAGRVEGGHGDEWWIRGIARVDDQGRVAVAGAPDAETELAGFRSFIATERPDITDSLDLLASWSAEDQREVPAGPDDPISLDTLFQHFDGALRAVQDAASEPDARRWDRGVRWDLRGVAEGDVVVLSLADDREVLVQVRLEGEGELSSYVPLGRALRTGWIVRVDGGDGGQGDQVAGVVPASVVTERGLLRLIVERADGSWSVTWEPATMEDDFVDRSSEQIELPGESEAGG